MALVSIDDALIIQAAKDNPDARPILKTLFPDVFKPKVPQIGQNYVRGSRVYVVTAFSDGDGHVLYVLVDMKNGVLWWPPNTDPTQIFGPNVSEFKKCSVDVTYAEIL